MSDWESDGAAGAGRDRRPAAGATRGRRRRLAAPAARLDARRQRAGADRVRPAGVPRRPLCALRLPAIEEQQPGAALQR